jgi:predicted transcriptional regulator
MSSAFNRMDSHGRSPDIRQAAHRLVDQLPEEASWDDLLYKIYVQQSIDRGLADVEAGRVKSHDEVVARFANPG